MEFSLHAIAIQPYGAHQDSSTQLDSMGLFHTHLWSSSMPNSIFNTASNWIELEIINTWALRHLNQG